MVAPAAKPSGAAGAQSGRISGSTKTLASNVVSTSLPTSARGVRNESGRYSPSALQRSGQVSTKLVSTTICQAVT